MKTYEIKGFWGFLFFTLVSGALLLLVIAIPVSFTWVAWNAIVGEVFHGPMIEFWQAIILTAAIAVAFQILLKPRLFIQVKRVKSPDELQKQLRKLKEGQDSSKD